MTRRIRACANVIAPFQTHKEGGVYTTTYTTRALFCIAYMPDDKGKIAAMLRDLADTVEDKDPELAT